MLVVERLVGRGQVQDPAAGQLALADERDATLMAAHGEAGDGEGLEQRGQFLGLVGPEVGRLGQLLGQQAEVRHQAAEGVA